jgi:hypothetical protein
LGEYLLVADATSEGYLEALSLSRELAPGETEEGTAELQRLAEIAEDCVFPTEPNIPDANVATMAQMVQTQTGIVTYMDASNELLECLEDIIDDSDLEDEDRELAIAGQLFLSLQ